MYMIKILLFFLLSCTPVFALRIDPNASSFGLREKRHVEVFDFQGEYPNLAHVDIDAKRKKDVELLLNGSYPLLEEINFEGGFGTIKGDLSGSFPKLNEVAISCTDADLILDLQAKWERECVINIIGTGDMEITLPKDVGLFVTISSSPFAKIHNTHPSLLQRKRKIAQRIFLTPVEEGKERLLKIAITATRGEITLK